MLGLKRSVIAVVACLLAGDSTARAEILIASIGPMTGTYASIGEQMRRGAEMAVTDRDDVRYVFSTFPIVERQETEAYGSYRSREFCLGYMNALAAGDPEAEIRL